MSENGLNPGIYVNSKSSNHFGYVNASQDSGYFLRDPAA
jgi:hypothetical protein